MVFWVLFREMMMCFLVRFCWVIVVVYLGIVMRRLMNFVILLGLGRCFGFELWLVRCLVVGVLMIRLWWCRVVILLMVVVFCYILVCIVGVSSIGVDVVRIVVVRRLLVWFFVRCVKRLVVVGVIMMVLVCLVKWICFILGMLLKILVWIGCLFSVFYVGCLMNLRVVLVGIMWILWLILERSCVSRYVL